jgi:hypothetical protein
MVCRWPAICCLGLLVVACSAGGQARLNGAPDAGYPPVAPSQDPPDSARPEVAEPTSDPKLGGDSRPMDASPEASPAVSDGAASHASTCTLVLGILTTKEWYRSGFEKVVDDSRWEIKAQDSAHIEKWADPQHAVWSLATDSPCARNASDPDRIVFMGVNYDYTTVAEFLPRYLAVLDNIKAKYPHVTRVDVMTYTRGPGNVECKGANRSNDSYIKPAQDEAIALLAKMFPAFVYPAPKWEVASCGDFTLCPHLSGAANMTIAKTIGEYFLAP